MSELLFSKIIGDLEKNKIFNFSDWLKYHSKDSNKFNEVVELCESFYYKTLTKQFTNITIEEKILILNAIALYSIEMEIEKPEGKILSTIIQTFIEIVRHYNLFIMGYLSMSGEILISDRNKLKFYSTWECGNIKVETPINLF